MKFYISPTSTDTESQTHPCFETEVGLAEEDVGGSEHGVGHGGRERELWEGGREGGRAREEEKRALNAHRRRCRLSRQAARTLRGLCFVRSSLQTLSLSAGSPLSSPSPSQFHKYAVWPRPSEQNIFPVFIILPALVLGYSIVSPFILSNVSFLSLNNNYIELYCLNPTAVC